MSKTITRLFDNYSDATTAVRELEALGIPHDNISIVANNVHGKHGAVAKGAVDHGDVERGAGTGAVVGGVGGLLAGLGLLAIPGLGPIVAAGWLAATAVGAGIGAAGGAATGGIIEVLKNSGHTDTEAHVYSEGVRRGGTLVSAKVSDDEAGSAEAILEGKSVNLVAREKAYRENGWTSFDVDAPAYTADEIDREQASYGSAPRF